MSNSMLLERSTPAVAPFGQPGTIPSGSPAAANWCVLPRCEISFEKCTGGLQMPCVRQMRQPSIPLQDALRRPGLLLVYLQWDRMLPHLPDAGHLQVRVHQGRLLHQLHERRREVLRDAASLLRLPRVLLRERLLLLHLVQQHAGLLRHLLVVRTMGLLARS